MRSLYYRIVMTFCMTLTNRNSRSVTTNRNRSALFVKRFPMLYQSFEHLKLFLYKTNVMDHDFQFAKFAMLWNDKYELNSLFKA